MRGTCIIAGSRSYWRSLGYTEDDYQYSGFNVNMLARRSSGVSLVNRAVEAAYDLHGWTKIRKVVCGKARGVDTFGEWWAEQHGIPVEPFPADWDMFGRRAGILRNESMATFAAPQGSCIVIWDGVSRGSEHMIQCARRKGLDVLVWEYKVQPQRLRGN